MKGPWPIRVVHGGAKLVERVVYGKKNSCAFGVGKTP